MTIRLKVVRRQEEQARKVKGLMDMFHIDRNQDYQPMGASNLSSNWTSVTTDPRIQKTKGLFEMFHFSSLDR